MSQKQSQREEEREQDRLFEQAQADDPVVGNAVTVNIMKGGVGKSAISMNLADRLGRRADVLYMDLDPNGHVTRGLGFDEIFTDPEHDFGDVILSNPTKEPESLIHPTEWSFDFVPASNTFEQLDNGLKNARGSTQRLHNNFLAPLMRDGTYDYCIMDGGGETSKLADNAFFAARQTLIPIQPGPESRSGFKRTWERIITEIRQFQPFKILAIVPTKIGRRIDHQNEERKLIEYLSTSERFGYKVPNFAYISPEMFDRIDNGEVDTLPKPGIREDNDFSKAYGQGMPLSEYDPESETVAHLDELADIVKTGGADR